MSYEDAPSDGSAWTEGGEVWLGSSLRVGRGGSWFSVAGNGRSANRDRLDPGLRYSYLGFRPVRWPSVP